MTADPLIAALHARRLEKGLTARALGDRIGYTARTLRLWEMGRKRPHPASLRDWAQGLDYELGDQELTVRHKSTRGRAASHKTPERYVDPLFVALRQRRIQLDIAVHELAARAGYAEDTLRKSETGRGVPNFRIIQNWAEALGMKLELVEK